MFVIKSDKTPSGDQPKAIDKLAKGISGDSKQTLLGVTGSGKTYTIANVIEKVQKPTLVLAHNKTLAAQLTQEFRELFPDNEVHYFVSYYDYYQPEAYVPITDTYIEKEAQINAEIDRLRHATTQALLTKKDVIVVASVSAIYGLGSPVEYEKSHLKIKKGEKLSREELMKKMIKLFFERTNSELTPGKFRVIGEYVEIMPVNEEAVYRVEFSNEKVAKIVKIHHITREIVDEDLDVYFLFPAKHFISNEKAYKKAIKEIEKELEDRLKMLKKEGRELEYERLRRRTLNDLSLIKTVGYCGGIENYSRHFDDRKEGEPPNTLLSFFPKGFLTVIDESHVTIPQLMGMFAGDRSRKDNLVHYGFRLPSAIDNRPLKFEEFNERVGPVIYVSATPGEYEKEKSSQIAEQIIRPTGLIDPVLDIRPVTEKGAYKGQVQDFIVEAKKESEKGNRVLVTTLTKKSSEDLAEFLKEAGLEAEYLHSDIKTLDRIELLTRFRKGEFKILVGVNLLREGLDLPEVTLVAIMDSDKEGFLRTETSLIQTIGRAARNIDGRAILYADHSSKSLDQAVKETKRRRELQLEYNKKHNITPRTIQKNIKDIVENIDRKREKTAKTMFDIEMETFKNNPKKLLKQKKEKMLEASKRLDFETAAILRDEIKMLENL